MSPRACAATPMTLAPSYLQDCFRTVIVAAMEAGDGTAVQGGDILEAFQVISQPAACLM